MPTPKVRAGRRRKPPQRRYVIDKFLKGELEGFHVVMGSTTAREAIRLRSGEMSEGDAIDFVASKVLEHDFDVADIRDLELEDVLALSQAWTDAIKDRAVPPAQGNS